MSVIGWLKFSLVMGPVIGTITRDLYRLTQGNVKEATTVVRRIRARGYKLDEAREDVDARLDALEEEKP
jgi:uncharacterized membrane-anchored protein YhcB (DUF1043 family)